MGSLTERIKAAQAASAPSLVPVKQDEPEVDDTPQIEDVLDAKLSTTIRRMVAESVALAVNIKALQAARDQVNEQIKKKLDLEGSPMKFRCIEGRLNYYPSYRSTLDKKLLLGAGVSPEVIVACTTIKEIYTLRITGAMEGE